MSRTRKSILLVSGLLAVVFMAWFSATIMHALPEILSHWGLGFGTLALSTALALGALYKPKSEQDTRKQPTRKRTQQRAQPRVQQRKAPAQPAGAQPFHNNYTPTAVPAPPAPVAAPEPVAAPPKAQSFNTLADSEAHIQTMAPESNDVHGSNWALNTSEMAAWSDAPPPVAEAPTVADPFAQYKAPEPVRVAAPAAPAAPSAPIGFSAPAAKVAPSKPAPAAKPMPAPPVVPATPEDDPLGLFSDHNAPPSMEGGQHYTFDLADMSEDISDPTSTDGSITGFPFQRGGQGISQRKARLEAFRKRLGNAPERHIDDLPSNLVDALNQASQGKAPPERYVTPVPVDDSDPYIDATRPALNNSKDINGVHIEPFEIGYGGMDPDDLNSLWQDYVEMNRQCGRDPARLRPDRFLAQLIDNHDAICSLFGCEQVHFRVKIKNGRPALSARPAHA